MIITTDMLVNGLRDEFVDMYEKLRLKQVDSRLATVMDLGITATNREHDFGVYDAAPHMALWRRGETIPTEGLDSRKFNVPIYEWGRRVEWHKNDRKDDQTQSLMRTARLAGTSAAMLPERMFFDLITNTGSLLPTIPNAADGVAMFSNNDATGNPRFGATNGNLLTGGGTTAAQILTDYYDCIVQWKKFQDGKGEPLLADEILAGGVIIIHPLELTEAMEQAFIQLRQIGTGGSTPSNVVKDANRNVELWGSPRLTDVNDWYCFLRTPPTQATFFMDREGVQEQTALEGDNNSDHVRDTGYEYIQWESRSGAAPTLPYAAMKVTNT